MVEAGGELIVGGVVWEVLLEGVFELMVDEEGMVPVVGIVTFPSAAYYT